VSWFVRQRVGGVYIKRRIGTPDDHVRADGEVVLTYAQAVERATSLQVEQRQPAPRHYSDGLTVNDVVDAYLTARTHTPGGRSNRVMAAGTSKVTRGAWRLYGSSGIGTKLVTAINAKALRDWHAGIVRMPPTNRGKALPFDPSNPEQIRARRSTANRVLTILKAALRHARNAGTLPDALPDYWARVPAFALGDDPTPRMLEADEIKRLLKAAAPDLRALLTAALMTGGRYSEIRALRATDYHAEQGVIRILQPKTGKTLWQPLTAEGAQFFAAACVGKAPSDLLFLRADGRPWEQSDVARPMRDAAKTAALEGVSFSVTRATYGKLLLLATRDLELVAKALGHSDSRITRKHYAQLLPSELAAGVAKLPSLGIISGKTNRQRQPRKGQARK
jgi:integrase